LSLCPSWLSLVAG
jgi:hypothetical protein